MPYYEFFLYAPKKECLKRTRYVLVHGYEFDPNTVFIRRSSHRWDRQLARVILSWVGIRRQDNWLMTITGPEVYRPTVHRVIEERGGFCDGGGYWFGYDPTGYYSDEQIDRHTEQWQREVDEANAVHLAGMTDEERAEYLQFIEALSKMAGNEPE
jgi:hypothetical protein